MASAETFIVEAIGPTAFGNRTSYYLQDIDLTAAAFSVEYAFIVPGEIDIGRLREALTRTLSKFPAFAGRLRLRGHKFDVWAVDLSNKGVPLAVANSSAKEIVPSSSITQDLSDLVQEVNAKSIMSVPSSTTEPLARFTVTRFERLGETVVGFSWWHGLGDAYMGFSIMKTLSQFYQGLSMLDDVPVYPETQPRSLAEPETTLADDKLYILPAIGDVAEPIYTRIDFRLTGQQLRQLRTWVLEQASTGERVKLSQHDCLMALVAFCINVANDSAPPLPTFYNQYSYRGTANWPLNLGGNAVVFLLPEPLEPAAAPTMFDYARNTRMNLLRAQQDPAFVEQSITFIGNFARHMAQGGGAVNRDAFVGLMVNSIIRHDRSQIHFGYPDKARFLTKRWRGPNLMHTYRPNPVLLPDGAWQARADDIEVVVHVVASLKRPFEEAMSVYVKKAGVIAEIEWIRGNEDLP